MSLRRSLGGRSSRSPVGLLFAPARGSGEPIFGPGSEPSPRYHALAADSSVPSNYRFDGPEAAMRYSAERRNASATGCAEQRKPSRRNRRDLMLGSYRLSPSVFLFVLPCGREALRRSPSDFHRAGVVSRFVCRVYNHAGTVLLGRRPAGANRYLHPRLRTVLDEITGARPEARIFSISERSSFSQISFQV